MVDGVRAVLSAADDITLVASSASVADLLASAEQLDVAILDLGLADGTTPTDNIKALRAAGVQPLVYTAGDDPYLLRQAARADVLASVTKTAPRDVLIEAVRSVAIGEAFFTKEWAAAIDGDPNLDRINLSPRQRQVLVLTASGERAHDVAKALGIDKETVNTYLKQIRHDYAVAGHHVNTSGAYYLAVKHGLVPSPVRDIKGTDVGS
jgi:DNA-binding NarL/FixJ family response regulator